jgi:microcompartment protein CcmL/EutN
MAATALTQGDVDKLEKAIARGVKTVQYANQSVTYHSMAEMFEALNYAKNALASSTNKATGSTLAVFDRS